MSIDTLFSFHISRSLTVIICSASVSGIQKIGMNSSFTHKGSNVFLPLYNVEKKVRASSVFDFSASIQSIGVNLPDFGMFCGMK